MHDDAGCRQVVLTQRSARPRHHDPGTSPHRPARMWSRIRRFVGGSPRATSVMAVVKYPGAIALTWMPRPANSSQYVLVNPTMPAFVAA